MANSNRNDGMNIERAVQQIMEEDDEEIYRENENSDSDVSDDDDDVLDPTYAPSILDAYHYDTDARIHSYYSTDSGSESGEEDEDIFNDLPTASSHSSATSDSLSTMPAMNTRTGKDGSVWSSSSSPQGRFRSHNIIHTRLHRVSKSEIYTPKDAFQVFFSDDIIEEILLCTNLQGRRVATKWNVVEKEELLAFIGVLLLAGVEKNWDLDTRQMFLDQKQNPTYKAAFGSTDLKTYDVIFDLMIREHEKKDCSRINWLHLATFGDYSLKTVRLNFPLEPIPQ